MDAYRHDGESLTVQGVPFADPALVAFLHQLDLGDGETMHDRGFHIEDRDDMAVTRLHGTTMDPKDALRYAGRSPLEGHAEGKPRYRGRSLDYPQPYREIWVRWEEPTKNRYSEVVLSRWETEHGFVVRTPTRKIYTGTCQAEWCAETFQITRSSRAKERRWNLYCSDDCAKEVRRVKDRERKRRKGNR